MTGRSLFPIHIWCKISKLPMHNSYYPNVSRYFCLLCLKKKKSSQVMLKIQMRITSAWGRRSWDTQGSLSPGLVSQTHVGGAKLKKRIQNWERIIECAERDVYNRYSHDLLSTILHLQETKGNLCWGKASWLCLMIHQTANFERGIFVRKILYS